MKEPEFICLWTKTPFHGRLVVSILFLPLNFSSADSDVTHIHGYACTYVYPHWNENVFIFNDACVRKFNIGDQIVSLQLRRNRSSSILKTSIATLKGKGGERP